MERVQSVFRSIPIRPNNGTDAFELLRQNKYIEVPNSLVHRFIEQLEKYTDFSFCFHFNNLNNNWTTFYRLEY